MNSLRALFCRAAALVALGGAFLLQGATPDAEGWFDLFDGKTLEGWRASENQGGFTVEDGVLVFRGRRSHLFYAGLVRGADFKNFEFEAEVMAGPHANSGIYFHTAYQETGFPRQGFEVQIANDTRRAGDYLELKKTGSLYGYRNIHKQLVPDGEWFTLRFGVRGKRVQVRLNDLLLVDYTEPVNPSGDASRPGRRLGSGTFALQGHDSESVVHFRKLRVRPLPDDLPDYPNGPVRFDEVDYDIIRRATGNYPLVDFHTHLKGGLTLEGVLENTRRTGINHGIAANAGLGFAITNDAGLDAFLREMAGQPVFVGVQAEGREWPTLFSPAALARFDYVFTDSMTLTDPQGRRTRLWIKEEVDIPDPEKFMDHLTDTIVRILDEEPVDIYANPTFLPEVLAADHDTLWTPARMQRVVDALRRNGVAVEINSRYRLPSLAFVRLAKRAGVKFTLGVNNTDAELGRSEYALEAIRECGLGWGDFWMPKPDGQKPIQTRRQP